MRSNSMSVVMLPGAESPDTAKGVAADVVNGEHLLGVAWQAWTAGRKKPSAISERQQERLQSLVAFARRHSRYYANLYEKVRPGKVDLSELPVVTKPHLMTNFEASCTDPVVRRADIEQFISDPTSTGQLYLGRYAVWTSSGVTGNPGMFLHDIRALTIYRALALSRGWLRWMSSGRLWPMLLHGFRVAAIVTTDGHFASAVLLEVSRKLHPWLASRSRIFSILTPTGELVQALNRFQPTLLVGYPTAIQVLAEEQSVGNLHIRPVLVVTGAESLMPSARSQIQLAFKCPVRDAYGASEFMTIAFECEYGWLHVNTDWVILEPVDAAYGPLSPGRPSYTVLLTNLANRVQPLIRYDLGDSITVRPDQCPCGSPFPAAHVSGRQNDTLQFRGKDGRTAAIWPMAVAAVVEETPGVRRFQLVQTSLTSVLLRIEVVPGADGRVVWNEVVDRLGTYFALQGVLGVSIERSAEPPYRGQGTGKFRQVWRTGQVNETESVLNC